MKIKLVLKFILYIFCILKSVIFASPYLTTIPFPRDISKACLLKNVDEAWEGNCEKKRELSIMPLKSSISQIDSKLESIHFPKLNFFRASLSSIVVTLSELSYELDQTVESEKRGVNIALIDPEERNPHVTLALRNVNLKQALELIAKSAGFYYDIENGAITLRYGSQANSSLQTQFFPITRAAVIKMIGLEHTLTDDVSCAKFNTKKQEQECALRQFFQFAGVPFDVEFYAPEGAQLAFDGSQLIVTQTPRNLEKIKNILARYKHIHQVEIESKFIEVQQGVLEELGFNWSFFNTNHSGSRFFQTTQEGKNNFRSLKDAFNTTSSSSGNGKLIMAASQTPETIANSAPSFPNALNIAANSVPTAGFLGVLKGNQFQLIINALEQNTGADLLSAPKVTVLSGKKARITVAQILRYPQSFGDIQSAVGSAGPDVNNSSAGVTITAGTPQNFTEKNVGVEMEVTPSVELETEAISLLLNPRVTEFEGFVEYGGRSLAISGKTAVHVPSGFFQPIFSTREIETEVTIPNGATVVMGGLTREEVKEVHDRLPVLHRIPIIGRLFQSKGKTNQKKNLLIFVTARLITV